MYALHIGERGEREREIETNFKDAQKRKEAKYTELVEEVEENNFVVDLITLEVGSRGFVNYDGIHRLRYVVGATSKELNDLLLSVSKLAIKESFQIWTCTKVLCEHEIKGKGEMGRGEAEL